jgi:putative endonuclease
MDDQSCPAGLEHKNKVVPGFTTKYGMNRLVWFEIHEDREAALRRERPYVEKSRSRAGDGIGR